jgi:peptide deformylase
MPLTEIVKLGDPRLLEKSLPVNHEEVKKLMPEIEKMWRLVREFREAYGRGRAIAAPQIGLLKRIICIDTGERYALINPVLEIIGDETMEVWDDCMSFPNLLVHLKRYRKVRIKFLDLNWKENIWELEDDMSELLQHEYDHLNGILAIMRARDINSLKWIE